jgi:hypothetical protein
MNGRSRFRRAAGTTTPIDVLGRAFRGPSPAVVAADIEAIDHGEGRTVVCIFRGLYGSYPRRFTKKMLDLTSDSLVLRPSWNSLSRKLITVTEPVLTAEVRERNPGSDWNLKAAGIYAAGQPLQFAGFVVISCQTASGTLEFAVPRPDVPLMLHVLQRHNKKVPADDLNKEMPSSEKSGLQDG